LKNIWSKLRSVGFGYINLRSKELEISRSSFEYNKGDVSIGFLGFEPDRGCIIFVRQGHEVSYGSISNIPVLGKVVGGRNVLSFLDRNDSIEEIKPRTYKLPIRRAELKDSIVKPLKIFTTLRLILSESSLKESELILALSQKERYFEISDATSVYAKDSRHAGIPIMDSYELRERKRANVTIRIKGEDTGSIYIYKKTVFPSKHHSYVGDIVSGIELIDVARKGERIPIVISPKRANVLGISQKEAEIYLRELGIEQVRLGTTDDDAIVVEQNPYYTIEAYKKKVVETIGLKKEDIFEIELYDRLAPMTAKYFRVCTGLLHDRIGKLTVHFSIPDFLIFKEKIPHERNLFPENIPMKIVKPFVIGVTNASSKFMGLIGIRLMPSNEYGPSGEKFVSSNIVGAVLSSQELLKPKKEGDTIYIRERRDLIGASS
jgi:putative methanogenesis marker protein 3